MKKFRIFYTIGIILSLHSIQALHAINSDEVLKEGKELVASGAEKTADCLKRMANALRNTAKTAGNQVEELLPAIQEAQQKYGKSFAKSFIAFGKEHRTMLFAGSVGVVVIGGTTYLVSKTGALTKTTDWIKNNPKIVSGLVGGTALLTMAGLPAADYLGYIDLQKAKSSAWTTAKNARSLVEESYQKEIVSAWQMIKGSVKTNAAIVFGISAVGLTSYMFFRWKPFKSMQRNDQEADESEGSDEPDEPSSSASSSEGTSIHEIKDNLRLSLKNALSNAQTETPHVDTLLHMAQSLKNEKLNDLIRKFCDQISTAHTSSTSGQGYGNAASTLNRIRDCLKNIHLKK